MRSDLDSLDVPEVPGGPGPWRVPGSGGVSGGARRSMCLLHIVATITGHAAHAMVTWRFTDSGAVYGQYGTRGGGRENGDRLLLAIQIKSFQQGCTGPRVPSDLRTWLARPSFVISTYLAAFVC